MKRTVKIGLVLGVTIVLGLTGCNTEVDKTDISNNPGATLSAVKLTGIFVTGIPEFTANNVFFAGESCDKYSLVVTAFYSDSSTKNVSECTIVPCVVRNTPGSVIFSYTEDGVTESYELNGAFYIAAPDALTQTPFVLDNSSGTLSGGTYYKFGDFPQTISAISDYSSVTVYNDWYLGSDGYFYAMIKENAYETGYKYSNGMAVEQSGTSSYKYFKVEPIKWRMLTDNYNRKKLLFSENILLKHRYDAKSNNYENSEIREYLNDTFWSIAFTSSAKSKIDETSVNNNAGSTNPNSNYRQWQNGVNVFAHGKTMDKVFLLSESEVTTEEYGFTEYNVCGSGNTRIRKTTDYAMASGAYQHNSTVFGGRWWLRSPYCYSSEEFVRYVHLDGSANKYASVNDSYAGVCPALCLKD